MEKLANDLLVEVPKYLATVPLIWWINASFGLFSCLCLWAIYYCVRRALGHEKFKGKWYTAETLHQLKQELYSGVREGRLPDSETMAFLDKHIYGKENKLRRLSGNDWL